MDQWAKTIIDTHRNPLKNLKIIGQKHFFPTHSEEETNLIDKYLGFVSHALGTERVERRSARAVGHWLPTENLIHIVKLSGIVNSFGFANKTGKYLYPEEGMFLLETNRIEIMWNNVPMSIQQAYEILVSNTQQYTQYRVFCLHGYHIKINRKYEVGEPSPKRLCVETVESTDNEMLKKLQSAGPQKFKPDTIQEEAQYRVFLPEHTGKSFEDLKFSPCLDKEISPDIALMDNKTIIGLDNSHFRYCSVNLPDLT